MDNHQRQAFRNKIKIRNKERKKVLDSNMWICKLCGYIGQPIKNQQGSWWTPVYRFIALLFFIIMFPLTAVLDWLLVVFGLRGHNSMLGNKIGRFTMSAPFSLYKCKSCEESNSMKKLSTQDGRFIYEKFSRDRFIKIND